MGEYILKTENLTKVYGTTRALSRINIEVKQGEIYGLIGQNGAGKTTLLKMISGLGFPTEGAVYLFGENASTNGSLLERIGVLIEVPGLYPDLRPYDNLKLKYIAYGMNTKEYTQSILEQVGLAGVEKKKVKKLSLGMKQRLGIALALIGEPDLLLLDEPINGLDPQGIIEIRDMLLKLNKEKGVTIIISSHILEELSKIATRFGIIHEGELVEEINKEELLEKTKDRLEITTNDIERAVAVLEDNLNIHNLQVIDNNTIYVYERLEESGDINNELLKCGIKVNSLSVNRESLEEYFISLTGGRKRV
ncbi:MAG TPA: ABC transporter ATP-binding protein [Clostridiales bacterium]|nr:ABC transporter ATP-binding protein [Clostridiales bacterium]